MIATTEAPRGYQAPFDENYRQMWARRKGQEPSYLLVRFFEGSRVVSQRILEEKYACKVIVRLDRKGSRIPRGFELVRTEPARSGDERAGSHRFSKCSAVWRHSD
jgi:hypothetical protein